jgi:hypothetical protein
MPSPIRKLIASAAIATFAPLAGATVLGFEDIGTHGFVPANYGGLDWSSAGWIAFGDPQAPYTAHAGDWRVATDFGSSDAQSTIRFTTPSIFEGAWFSGYGEATVSFELYAAGQLVANSATLAPGVTPAFLASGYAGLVDAVVVASPMQAFYALDDFTFTGATAAVPEPQSWALLAGGLGIVALLAHRRRRL